MARSLAELIGLTNGASRQRVRRLRRCAAPRAHISTEALCTSYAWRADNSGSYGAPLQSRGPAPAFEPAARRASGERVAYTRDVRL